MTKESAVMLADLLPPLPDLGFDEEEAWYICSVPILFWNKYCSKNMSLWK